MSTTEPAPADDRPERSTWTTVFNLAMFIIGGLALAWMLRSTSWTELKGVVVGVGAWAGVILGLEVASMCLDAAAWHAFMRPEARMVPYWRVLGAWASGRAINVLTPGGALGEATKVTMLFNHAPRARVLSSLVLFNLGTLYFSVTVMLIGIPITLFLLDLPDSLKVTIGIGVAVLVPLMIALAIVIHRGAVATLVNGLRHSHIISRERSVAWKEKLIDIDKHIRQLHTSRSAGTWRGLVFVAVSKVVSYASTLTLISAVGVDLTPSLVIATVSAGVLITWISSIVPLGMGLAEGGNYALYDLLGSTGEHGMFVTMLTRMRVVAVAMLGLAAMAAMSALTKYRRTRIQHKIRELKDQQSEG